MRNAQVEPGQYFFADVVRPLFLGAWFKINRKSLCYCPGCVITHLPHDKILDFSKLKAMADGKSPHDKTLDLSKLKAMADDKSIHDKISDFPKFKAIAGDKSNMYTPVTFVYLKLENMMKKENVYSPFSTMYSKVFFLWVDETRECVVKDFVLTSQSRPLTLSQTSPSFFFPQRSPSFFPQTIPTFYVTAL